MEVTLLPLLVNSWHLGPVLSPGVTSGSQKTGCPNRNLGVWRRPRHCPSPLSQGTFPAVAGPPHFLHLSVISASTVLPVRTCSCR